MLSFMAIPTLETGRLRLRGWREEDIAPMTEINADPAVTRWLGPIDPLLTGSRIAAWMDHWRLHGFGLWAVEEKGSKRFVGRVGLVRHDDWTASAHDAEIGWTLSPSVWGRGYATEAARAVIEWARGQADLTTIISITRPDNLGSRRVMEKLGLTYGGMAAWHDFEQVWYAIDLHR